MLESMSKVGYKEIRQEVLLSLWGLEDANHGLMLSS